MEKNNNIELDYRIEQERRMTRIETKIDNLTDTLSEHIKCQGTRDEKQDDRLDDLEKGKASSSEVESIRSLLLKIGLWITGTVISGFALVMWYIITHTI